MIKQVFTSFVLFTISLFSVSHAQQFLNVTELHNIIHNANDANFQAAPFGTGVSFFDFDDDGWDDITLVRYNDSVQFYKNMGGTYLKMPSFAFAPGATAQAIWVDYDNDGDADFFLSTYNSGQCRLFRNDGNWTFTDVTAVAGLIGLNSRNYGVSFADYDNDGDLDFYLCRYQSFGIPIEPLNINALFRNNGNGTFTNVTQQAGVGDGLRLSFMGGWMDYDQDGWPDLMVINDKPSHNSAMYKNMGNGTFQDMAGSLNLLMSNQDPMSITFADFDHDGDIDIFASNTGHPESLARLFVYENGTFTDQAPQRGVALDQWSWGSVFLDYDNNTFLDLYVTTGYTYGHWEADVPSVFYINDSTNHFYQASSDFFVNTPIAASFGVALGDIQNDGYPDMMVSNGRGTQSMLFENLGGTNNYAKVTLKGTLSNRMAIGSWIRVYAGGQTFTHYTRCGENYCSQNSQHHIFGMGAYQNIDSITVSYMSGIQDVYYNLPVNQHYTFIEGETLSFALDIPSQTSVCMGSSVELIAPNYAQYTWNTGAQSQSITVTQSGEYFLTAVNAQGHIYHSDTITIFVSDPVNIVNESTDASCYGVNDGSVTLQVQNQTNNYAINWSNGAQGFSVEALGAGSYTYNYMDEFGCIFSGEVTIYEPEEIVVFTEITPQTSTTLGSMMIAALGGNPPFLYYLNGNLASTNNELQGGSYVLTVVDAEGCEVILDVVVPFDDDSSIDDVMLHNIVVYPNPTTQAENIQIQLTSGLSASSMKLVDGSGRIVYELKNTATQSTLVIPTAQLESGVYYVMLEIDGLWITRKVVLSDF